jgi:hypothetical protein
MKLRDWFFGPKGVWLGIWISFLVLTVIIVLLGSIFKLNPWGDVSCDRVFSYASEQCEAITKDGFLRQQANFWSNFAYGAVGLFIFFRRGTTIGKAVGLAFVFLGIGSGLFHGTLTTWGQYLDIMGIDVLLLLLVLHAIFSVWNLRPQMWAALSWILFLTLLGFMMGGFKGIFDSTLVSLSAGGVLFVLGVYGSGRRHDDWYGANTRWYKWFWFGVLAAVLFSGASVFKFLDGKEIKVFAPEQQCLQCNNCQPVDEAPVGKCTGLCPSACCDVRCGCCQEVFESVDKPTKCNEIKPRFACFGSNPVIQGHALWHVFSAFGLFFVFEFFGSLFVKPEP